MRSLWVDNGPTGSQGAVAQIFIAELADFPVKSAVWEARLPAGHAPPRATVKAALAKPEWRAEMVVTAGL